MTETKSKTGQGFWIIGIVALIWNLIGVFFYLQQAYMTEADLAALPDGQRALYENIPAWVTGAFAIAVFGGTLGAILLLLKKKSAKMVFVISLAGVIAQHVIYTLLLSDAMSIMGPTAAIMPVIVLIIAIYLVVFSNQQIQKGVLK